ncbi:MAG: DUF2914 domain-containing protein [bacterium]|nr:DUF2914 domain-containing protein [bacterium]
MKSIFAWVEKHERHLSAAAMVGGFVFDNLFFNRIDEAITHTVFISYLLIAAFAISFAHYLEEHTVEGLRRPRWRSLLPIATQFAFGGLWSGFLIFFSRSATLAASWPFLLILGSIFLGNEILKKYHDRLVFNAVLYFFALYSYSIFAVPLLTHAIGTGTFILSGVVAVALFAVFMLFLRRLGRFRLLKSVWQIRFWAGIVFLLLNIFYFTNILPPLPLTLAHGGIYHSVIKIEGGYSAQVEDQPWYTSFGLTPALHVAFGEPLYAYSAVFAPIALNTKIVHEWQWYDETAGRWVTRLSVSFPISGGRGGGYRGYTIENNLQTGGWRVNIKTPDGRLIGRLGFTVVVGVRSETTTIPL